VLDYRQALGAPPCRGAGAGWGRGVVGVVEERSRAVRVAVAEPFFGAAGVPVGRRVVAPGRSTQAARRQLMRSVTAEVPEPREGGDRAARRDALLHSLEMSRRRRRPGRR